MYCPNYKMKSQATVYTNFLWAKNFTDLLQVLISQKIKFMDFKHNLAT